MGVVHPFFKSVVGKGLAPFRNLAMPSFVGKGLAPFRKAAKPPSAGKALALFLHATMHLLRCIPGNIAGSNGDLYAGSKKVP